MPRYTQKPLMITMSDASVVTAEEGTGAAAVHHTTTHHTPTQRSLNFKRRTANGLLREAICFG